MKAIRKLFLALVTAKCSSRKVIVQVKVLGMPEALAPAEYLRILKIGLLATQYCGLRDGATRLRASHIVRQLVSAAPELLTFDEKS